MRTSLIAIFIALLCGCSTSQRAYDGQGNPIVSIACIDNQTAGGMTSCLKEAEKACPSGYQWAGSTDHPLAWQVTEETQHQTPAGPGMPNGTGVDEPPAVIALYAMGLYTPGKARPGGIGWSPRVTKNRGDYQYITIRCK